MMNEELETPRSMAEQEELNVQSNTTTTAAATTTTTIRSMKGNKHNSSRTAFAFDRSGSTGNNSLLAVPSSQSDCGDNAESMMDAVDSCVACIDGVHQQHDYETNMLLESSSSSPLRNVSVCSTSGSNHKRTTPTIVAEDHGLTDAETAIIRLQIMEETNKMKKSVNDDGEDIHDTEAAKATMDTIGMLTLETLDLCGDAVLADDPDVTVVSANTMAVFQNTTCTTNPNNQSTTTSTTTNDSTSTGATDISTSPIVVEKGATMTNVNPTIASPISSPQDVLATFQSEEEPMSPTSPTASLAAAAAASRTSLLDREPDIDANTTCCAICFDEAGGTTPESLHSTVTFCYLPCCGSNGREETSTTKVCTACILLLTSPTNTSTTVSTPVPTTNTANHDDDDLKKPSPPLTRRIGRCPRCRHWIAVSTDTLGIVTTIEPIHHAGKCIICNQEKEFLVQEAQRTNNNHDDTQINICDACFLGRRRPLVYECEQCHATQRIPHPMYRYQTSMDTFGKTSWACQGLCQNFTMWRILPEQVRYIPPGDTPESWGDDYLEVARERVREARQGIARNGGGVASSTSSGCIVS